MGKWCITIWGVRGSFPHTGADYRVYGGNTTCITLDAGASTIIFDAGSGLAEFDRTLSGDKNRLDILLGHLHMDHLLGFFSFGQLYDPGMEIHLYGAEGLKEHLETLIGPPYWPVSFSDFPAKVIFHEIPVGNSFHIGEFQIDTMATNHPNGGILYRLNGDGRQLFYALDCELAEQLRPKLSEFCHGSDLIIWDANYTASDLRPGWGHSTWEQGIGLRRDSDSKQILMTHFNQSYTDEFLRRQQTAAEEMDSSCYFAREGMVLTL